MLMYLFSYLIFRRFKDKKGSKTSGQLKEHNKTKMTKSMSSGTATGSTGSTGLSSTAQKVGTNYKYCACYQVYSIV